MKLNSSSNYSSKGGGAVNRASPINKDDILRYAIENGILDLPDIEAQIEMNIRNKYLEMHTHKIWETSDGKWCTYIPDETKDNNRALCKRKTKKEVEDVVIEYWKQFDENPTIKEVFDEWNDRKLQRGQIKKSSYTTRESIFNRFYSEFGKRNIKSVSEPEWEDFLCDCIVDYNLSAKAFADLKSITKGFLKRAKKRRLISMNVESFFLELDVSDNDFKKHSVNEEDEVFFDDEIDMIMKYIRNHQDIRNVGIALMFVSGIRVGELVGLKHEDFDGTSFQVKRTMIRYRVDSEVYKCDISEFPKTPAGYRTIVVPSNQKWICDKLKLFNPFSDYIFMENDELINTDKIRKRLYSICKEVGIKPRSPHKIRKTYGSILLDNGVDTNMIIGQMGHTDIICTERFYHRNRKRLEQKQRIIDSIPEFMASGK